MLVLLVGSGNVFLVGFVLLFLFLFVLSLLGLESLFFIGIRRLMHYLAQTLFRTKLQGCKVAVVVRVVAVVIAVGRKTMDGMDGTIESRTFCPNIVKKKRKKMVRILLVVFIFLVYSSVVGRCTMNEGDQAHKTISNRLQHEKMTESKHTLLPWLLPPLLMMLVASTAVVAGAGRRDQKCRGSSRLPLP